MKKGFALFLSLLMLLGCLSARAEEPAALTVDELIGYCDHLLEEALLRGAETAEPDDEGGYRYDYGDFALYSPDDTLTENSRVTGAQVMSAGGEMADMRGIGLGASLDALLAAYPLDNADLTGTYEGAALYISGMLPDTVNIGYVVRTGSHVLVLAHEVYTANGDTAEKCGVIYTLENNAVMAMEVLLDDESWSLDEAQDYIDELARLQEADAYSMYREANPAPLAREDLRFGAIDFVSASADDMTAALGAAQNDSWENDTNGFLRVMQWEGVQAIFQYDAQRKNASLQLLQVFGEALEGPRGLHMDDSLESALRRFPHEAEVGVLYGDGENAPYGLCDVQGDSAKLVYAAAAEEGAVLLEADFESDRLLSITCTWQ